MDAVTSVTGFSATTLRGPFLVAATRLAGRIHRRLPQRATCCGYGLHSRQKLASLIPLNPAVWITVASSVGLMVISCHLVDHSWWIAQTEWTSLLILGDGSLGCCRSETSEAFAA